MTAEWDDVYTRSAEVYDLIYERLIDYPQRSERLRSIIEGAVPGARRVLEAACGTGLYLEQLGRWYEVTGFDLSEPMLERARKRCRGVTLHRADMTDFGFDERFDAVLCLFSSIGYVRTEDGLHRSIAAMADHTNPGGIVVVEPWFRPDTWDPGHIGADLIDYPEVKIARLSTSEVVDGCSVMDMHHMVATTAGVEVFTERHVMGLFTVEQHLAAFDAAGLETEYDGDGLSGRGLYVGRKPPAAADNS